METQNPNRKNLPSSSHLMALLQAGPSPELEAAIHAVNTMGFSTTDDESKLKFILYTRHMMPHQRAFKRWFRRRT